jgi:hypothetical protein
MQPTLRQLVALSVIFPVAASFLCCTASHAGVANCDSVQFPNDDAECTALAALFMNDWGTFGDGYENVGGWIGGDYSWELPGGTAGASPVGWMAAALGTPTDLCTFNGLTCGPNGRVTRLDLSSFHTVGAGFIPLNATLGGLVALTYLDLSHNLLVGSLPDALGSLINLRHLDVRMNSLLGALPPSLEQLSQLTFLGLYDGLSETNSFTDDFPLAALSSLTNLAVGDALLNPADFPWPETLQVNVTSTEQLSLMLALISHYSPPSTFTASAVLQADLELSSEVTIATSLRLSGDTASCLASRPAGSAPVMPLCTIFANHTRHLKLQSGALTLDSIAFVGGYDDLAGGSIAADGGSLLSVRDCAFVGNAAGLFGGAIFMQNQNTALALSGCFFENNSQNVSGTGRDGWLSNFPPGGSAVYSNAPLNLTDCVISSNTAAQGLGAVAAPSATATRCTFHNNVAGLKGGAFAVNTDAFSAFGNCPAVGNTIPAAPCSIQLAPSISALTLSLCNCTGNVAQGGSGVFPLGCVATSPSHALSQVVLSMRRRAPAWPMMEARTGITLHQLEAAPSLRTAFSSVPLDSATTWRLVAMVARYSPSRRWACSWKVLHSPLTPPLEVAARLQCCSRPQTRPPRSPRSTVSVTRLLPAAEAASV